MAQTRPREADGDGDDVSISAPRRWWRAGKQASRQAGKQARRGYRGRPGGARGSHETWDGLDDARRDAVFRQGPPDGTCIRTGSIVASLALLLPRGPPIQCCRLRLAALQRRPRWPRGALSKLRVLRTNSADWPRPERSIVRSTTYIIGTKYIRTSYRHASTGDSACTRCGWLISLSMRHMHQPQRLELSLFTFTPNPQAATPDQRHRDQTSQYLRLLHRLQIQNSTSTSSRFLANQLLPLVYNERGLALSW